jgi:hypothetical protein
MDWNFMHDTTGRMSQGDSLVVALSATMALMLASRALRTSRLSFKVKAGMALAWVVLIVSAALIASWWQS